MKVLRRIGIALVTVVALIMATLWVERPHTPPVRDADGRQLPGSVALLERVELGRFKQWILVRGDPNKPLVLFLHGGPGMPMMWMAHRIQRPLEDEFLLVHWDQRGAGKSFADPPPIASMTDEQILADALQLIRLLQERYGKDRVLLVGHSWGSYIGTVLAARHPELLHAYVGIGQVTGSAVSDSVTEAWLRHRAREAGEPEALGELDARGEAAYEKWLFRFGGEIRDATNYLPFIWTGLKAPEYGLGDVARVGRGSGWSSEHMREIAVEGPLSETVTCLAVPVRLFLGRTDYVTPSSLALDWLRSLRSPSKRAVWFEASAHFPHYEEPEAFTTALRDVWESVKDRLPTDDYCAS